VIRREVFGQACASPSGLLGLAAGTVAAICLAPAAGAGVMYRVERLDTFDGPQGFRALARAVNDSGVVAGDATRRVGTAGNDFPAVRWEANTSLPTELDSSRSGLPDGIGWGINNAGDIVGAAMAQNLVRRPFRWAAGGTAATELGSLPATPFVDAHARAINDRGDVVGYQRNFGIRWPAGGTAATPLGNLGTGPTGSAEVFAYAINESGDAVGSAADFQQSGGRGRAVVWPAGGTAAVLGVHVHLLRHLFTCDSSSSCP